MCLTQKSSYHFTLPEDLIAQQPLPNRTDSRLLHLDKYTGEVVHYNFPDIVKLLNSEHVLVLNETKVFPARLCGKKHSGAKIEILLLNRLDDNKWTCLVKPGKKALVNTEILFSDALLGKIVHHGEEGERIIDFSFEGNLLEHIQKVGMIPLPHYIKREPDEQDKESYQTTYAKEMGSVAAPTAGLHFTPEILNELQEKGVNIYKVLLHVGIGTFRPVKTESILDHKMHKEYCEISPEVAEALNQEILAGKKIVAVGSTTTRTLESFAENDIVQTGKKWTDIFIYPGKEFKIVKGIITNFHLPESTLLMMISAFAGHDKIMQAYNIAVQNKYRFFSYGDAMVIL